MTRGIRNNNPANIRRGSAWLGLSANQNDREFCQFDSVEYGIRAFFVLMRTYHYKYECNSIGQILYRFAPPCENNTFAYIAFVTKYLNQNQTDMIFIETTIVNIWLNKQAPSVLLRAFAKAVFMMESNYEVTDEQINKVIELL